MESTCRSDVSIFFDRFDTLPLGDSTGETVVSIGVIGLAQKTCVLPRFDVHATNILGSPEFDPDGRSTWSGMGLVINGLEVGMMAVHSRTLSLSERLENRATALHQIGFREQYL